MQFQILEIILSISFSLVVGLFAYLKKSISKSGFVALILICGIFIGSQSYSALAILFAMFASSSVLSRYKSAQKEDMDKVVAKTGPRDAFQAIANLGIAIICYVAYLFFGHEGFQFAFLGSVAASNADSWASEIGGLSSQKPVMISTFKPIPKGISGGVTVLGTLGGVLGALFIGLLGLLLVPVDHPLWLLIVSVFAGILGFMIDSILGAIFQAQYLDLNNEMTERKDKGSLAKGIAWVDNDMVNLLSSFLAALISIGLYFVLV